MTAEKLEDLIVRSESRIDRTNEMVFNLVNVINKITEEYVLQINKLQDSRDSLISQNQQLIKLMEERNKEIELVNKKYDSLLDKLVSMKNCSENNINVN